MLTQLNRPNIYDDDGDRLMQEPMQGDRIVLVPDRPPPRRPTHAQCQRNIRIMWGQWLLEDILANRYRTLVCAVNAHDNSHGIITQLAQLLPTSQWTETSITAQARHYVQPQTVSIVKFDMDSVEVLALLRPSEHDRLSLEDLSLGFRMVAAMMHRRPQRYPSASVCFLGAQANKLADPQGSEPSFETVLRTMHDSGYRGDVYPATWMWESAPTAVFARYPFPESVDRMREGGF
jgi:hypothetical protein